MDKYVESMVATKTAALTTEVAVLNEEVRRLTGQNERMSTEINDNQAEIKKLLYKSAEADKICRDQENEIRVLKKPKTMAPVAMAAPAVMDGYVVMSKDEVHKLRSAAFVGKEQSNIVIKALKTLTKSVQVRTTNVQKELKELDEFTEGGLAEDHLACLMPDEFVSNASASSIGT